MLTCPPSRRSPAERVLDCLRGYSFRQTFVPDDVALVQEILDEWRREVDALQRDIAARDAQIADLTDKLKGMTFAAYGYRTP